MFEASLNAATRETAAGRTSPRTPRTGATHIGRPIIADVRLSVHALTGVGFPPSTGSLKESRSHVESSPLGRRQPPRDIVLTLSFAFGYVARGDNTSAAVVPSPATSGDPSAGKTLDDTSFKNINDVYAAEQIRRPRSTIDRQTLYRAAISGLLQTFPDSGTFYVDRILSRPAWGVREIRGHRRYRRRAKWPIVIVAPIENTPAERAGLKPGMRSSKSMANRPKVGRRRRP